MPSTRAAEPPGKPRRRHRMLAAMGLHRGGRIDEEELGSAILGTVVGLSTMVAAGAHGTLGQVELTVLVTVAIYWAADCYARLLAARGAGRRAKVGSVLRRQWPMVEAAPRLRLHRSRHRLLPRLRHHLARSATRCR